MIGIRLSRQAQRDSDLEFEPSRERDAAYRHVDEQGSARALMRELDEIGNVPQGSLEEAIWRELGALPRSRRTTPGIEGAASPVVAPAKAGRRQITSSRLTVLR
jgi:hypothetical protein